MKFLSVLFCLHLCLTGCNKVEPKLDTSRIYFSARAVPGANIYSINLAKELIRHTNNSGGRDSSLGLDDQGNLFFTSTRILPEDRAARAKIGKYGNRRQDLNALYLKAGAIEERRENLTQSIGKTGMPESSTAISIDGKQFSFVRTILSKGAKNKSMAELEKIAHDELYVQAGLNGAEEKVSTADVIIGPRWSSDGKSLVFSSYTKSKKTSHLSVYNIETGKTEQLLENPWGINQIDSAQWSPDGKYISIILHPIEKKRLRELYVMDVKSKELKKISKEFESVQSSVSWSKDSQKIAYGALIDSGDFKTLSRRPSDDIVAHIFVADLNGNSQQLTKEPTGIDARPVFSPDNQHIAFKRADEPRSRKASLLVMNLKTGIVETIHSGLMRKGHMIWQ